MIGKDRLGFPIGGRLGFRIGGRLRFPALRERLGGFPCTGAVSAGGCAADISTSASKCSQSRLLPSDPWRVPIVPLRAVRLVRRVAPLGHGASAAGCAFHFKVTGRDAVLSADRVVAGRRCLIVPARLARPDAPVGCCCASAGEGCTGVPAELPLLLIVGGVLGVVAAVARVIVTRRSLASRTRLLVLAPDSFDPGLDAVLRSSAGDLTIERGQFVCCSTATPTARCATR